MDNDPVSVDEYLSARKHLVFGDRVFKAAKGPRSLDPESRSAVFVMSTADEDRDFDIIKTSGIEIPEHLPALRNHNPNQHIGSWADLKKGNKYLEGTLKFAEEGTNPFVDETFSLLRQGHLRGASVGFVPLKIEGRKDEKGERIRGYIIERSELVECSVVAVPSNRASGIKGLQEHGVPLEVIEYVLDELVKTPAGVIVLRQEFERAHKEATGERTSVVMSSPTPEAELVAPARSFIRRALDALFSEENKARIENEIGGAVEPVETKAAPEPPVPDESAILAAAIDEAERRSLEREVAATERRLARKAA